MFTSQTVVPWILTAMLAFMISKGKQLYSWNKLYIRDNYTQVYFDLEQLTSVFCINFFFNKATQLVLYKDLEAYSQIFMQYIV